MPLEAEDNVQKLLLSSTSRFVGEYRNPDFVVAHAWLGFGTRDRMYRDLEGPLSRSSFVFAFRTEPTERKAGIVVPDYSGMGEVVASYLSVLFGKRFDSHGAIESSGSYRVPDFSEYSQICWPWLPQNSHQVRADLGVPLNLGECHKLLPVLTGTEHSPELVSVFQTACYFYARALRAVERDPEIAYLHLITVGELLAAQRKYERRELLDARMLDLLATISRECTDGESIVREITKRLAQVKRGFVRVILDLVDSDFFSGREAINDYGALKADSFESTIGAAYDLRSRYVHDGTPFGVWVGNSAPKRLDEIQVGAPVVQDKDFAKTLKRAPTLIGLERVMRYALFRFAEHSRLFALADNESLTAGGSSTSSDEEKSAAS